MHFPRFCRIIFTFSGSGHVARSVSCCTSALRLLMMHKLLLCVWGPQQAVWCWGLLPCGQCWTNTHICPATLPPLGATAGWSIPWHHLHCAAPPPLPPLCKGRAASRGVATCGGWLHSCVCWVLCWRSCL